MLWLTVTEAYAVRLKKHWNSADTKLWMDAARDVVMVVLQAAAQQAVQLCLPLRRLLLLLHSHRLLLLQK